jgi:hypothetical protein
VAHHTDQDEAVDDKNSKVLEQTFATTPYPPPYHVYSQGRASKAKNANRNRNGLIETFNSRNELN